MWGVNSCTGIAYNHFETSSYLNASQIMSNEELMSILPLQVISNVQTSLNIFLQSEELNEPDAFFVIFVRASSQHLLITKPKKLVLIWSCS